jgi:Sulfotransferase family
MRTGTSMTGAGNPCLFIVGCLRSGTTMFRHVVNAHPELAVVNETQWLPRLFEQRHRQPGWTADDLVTEELLPALLALERFMAGRPRRDRRARPSGPYHPSPVGTHLPPG